MRRFRIGVPYLCPGLYSWFWTDDEYEFARYFDDPRYAVEIA
jgi:hypothetical protein